MNQSNTIKSLSDCVVGDEVELVFGTRCDVPSLAKITRVTKTQILVGDSRFRRDTGFLVGGSSGSWSRCYISVPTPERRKDILLEIRRRRAIGALIDMSRGSKDLPEDLVNRIYELYQMYKLWTSEGPKKE